MRGNASEPASAALFAPAATGFHGRLNPPAPVEADRPQSGRSVRVGSASRLGLSDLVDCREVLRRLGLAFGAAGQPDRAGPLLGAAEVLRELLERLETPARSGPPGRVGAGAGRRAAGRGRPANGEVAPVSEPRRPLSRRERDVLALLIEGCSNAAIAEVLKIGQRTAESHVANILGKLDVPSRTAAIAYAVRHGLIV